MKLQLKAVANEYFMNNNCIYVILSRQPTNWSPVHLLSSYFAISENTNIMCAYTILIWPQMIQGQMSRPVNNKILWKMWVIEKNRMSGKMSFVGRDCLQSSNLVQIEGCSDAILTTRVKTGRYSISKWVRLHSGFGRVIVFGVWIYCVWMDERTRILVTFWLKPISH